MNEAVPRDLQTDTGRSFKGPTHCNTLQHTLQHKATHWKPNDGPKNFWRISVRNFTEIRMTYVILVSRHVWINQMLQRVAL